MKITRQILEAAMRMRTAEMIPLTNYLREERREIMEKLTTAPADQVQVLQGEARRLGAVLDLIDNASATIEQMEKV